LDNDNFLAGRGHEKIFLAPNGERQSYVASIGYGSILQPHLNENTALG
jgi:hypothetical protein